MTTYDVRRSSLVEQPDRGRAVLREHVPQRAARLLFESIAQRRLADPIEPEIAEAVRISHQAASVHVLPQKNTPSGRMIRSDASPLPFAYFRRNRRCAT